MENINKILEFIYNSNNGMLYFYVVTGSIALILIILIIINIKKDKKQVKENIQVESKPIEEPIVKENIVDKKEIEAEEIVIETNINNNIPNVEENIVNLIKDNNNESDALDMLYKSKENKEEEIELPKTKEIDNLSSESFLERLNALKNK